MIDWLNANETVLSSIAAIIAILSAGFLAIKVLFRRRDARPNELAIMEFKNLWPKLSRYLHEDIDLAIVYTEQGREVAESSGHGPVLNIQPLKISNGNEFTPYHWKTIAAYDKDFARRLTLMSDTVMDLRRVSNDRNQLLYRQETGTNRFERAVKEIYGISRKLERVADSLDEQVKHYDDVIGSVPS
jgi:hypothetical protein